MLNIPPISAVVHKHIATLCRAYRHETILDIGGIGRLNTFIKTDVVDANICNGIDGQNLPYHDCFFDITVSIATLEHVGDHKKFLKESIRTAKYATIHWVLYGKWAEKVEHIKKKFGHKHPCKVPKKHTVDYFMKHKHLKKADMYSTVTCREHLLVLATMRKRLNNKSVYSFIEKYGNKPYGYIIIGVK